MATKTAKKSPKRKASTKKLSDPKAVPAVAYDKVAVRVCQGDKAITAEEAKRLLGWVEEPDGKSWGNDYLLKDVYGKKICCVNNTTNRPLQDGLVALYKQEHLRKRWRFNGETIIIGKTGKILEGQHTLCSLVLAAQEWAKDPDRWKEYWSGEPTMEKLAVFGIEEDDETVNTINTGKPRSLSDVIARSEFFAGLPKSTIVKLSKITDHAVKLVWSRTGIRSAFSLQRTHSEALAFIHNHSRLLEAVKHVYEEEGDSERKISKHLSLGYSAGLIFLMAAGHSNRAAYYDSRTPNEDALDFSNWDLANDFFTELAGGGKRVSAIITRLTDLVDEHGGATVNERTGILAKAWLLYAEDKPIRDEDLSLEYKHDSDGYRKLIEFPTVGGIDLGSGKTDDDVVIEPDVVEDLSTDDDDSDDTPSDEEVVPGKAEPVREQRKRRRKARTVSEDRSNGGATAQVAAANESESNGSTTKFRVGWHVRVKESDGDTWEGVVTGITRGIVDVRDLRNKTFQIPAERLQKLRS